MTSSYPAEYYYPELLHNHSHHLHHIHHAHHTHHTHVSNSKPRAASISIQTSPVPDDTPDGDDEKKDLPLNIIKKPTEPVFDISKLPKVNPEKQLIRNPPEKSIPNIIVHDNILNQPVRPPTLLITNLDDRQTGTNTYTNGYLPYQKKPPDNNQNLSNNNYNNGYLPYETKLSEMVRTSDETQDQAVKTLEDEQSANRYWQKEILFNREGVVTIEPIDYDKKPFYGPFGLSRTGTFIFYIIIGILIILAAVFLIMTGVFYSQKYPDSSSNIAEIAGMAVCGFVFYLGLLLILFGLWHQRYQKERSSKQIKTVSTKPIERPSSEKPPVEKDVEIYDQTYQPAMKLPPYVSTVTEKVLLKQPAAATGKGYYEPFVWLSDVHVENLNDDLTKPNPWSLNARKKQDIIEDFNDDDDDDDASSTTGVPNNNNSVLVPNRNFIQKNERLPTKTVIARPKIEDFDDLQAHVNIEDEPLPELQNAPETNELIKNLAQMELTHEKYSKNDETLTNKNNQMKPIDMKTDVSSAVNFTQLKNIDSKTDVSSSATFDQNPDDGHRHHRHHHRHRHHHSPHRHHHHHRNHHHHHRHHSPSNSSQYSHHSPDYHHHHHHHQPVSLPRIITPRRPKVITPTVPKMSTTIYRETGINTGIDTKIMRDEGVTANLEDLPETHEPRLGKIPIIRRTVIVEPYPSEPSSHIVVKPTTDMIGKIRLGKTLEVNNDTETIIYPTTAFIPKKKSKKKRRSTLVNNNLIEDLRLEDISNDDDYERNYKVKSPTKRSPKKTIKNAFYN